MITVKPFKAIRPTRDKAYLLASRSYVSYSEKRLFHKLNNNPFTFLHVINPDYHSETKLEGDAKYEAVRAKFNEFAHLGYFTEEEKPAFYIYQQQAENHVFTGIIGATSVKDYREGRIKVHEHTLTQREEMFVNYLAKTGFNAEPVLLMHKPLISISQIKSKYMDQRAEYEFTSTDKVLHLLWPITQEEDVKAIEDGFKQLDAVYIADGHHRCSSSAGLAERLNREGDTPDKYFMSFLMPETTIKIHSFNRLVRDLNGMNADEFIEKLEEHFYVRPKTDDLYDPWDLHEMSMYLNGYWYSLFVKPGLYNPEDSVDSLDCEILSRQLLDPILGITDLKTDKRIDFLPGNTRAKGLKEAVDSGEYIVGFGLHAIGADQLKRVADEGKFMPPKSTYIEPKLRSGLTIYNLEK